MRSRRAEVLRERWFGHKPTDWQSYHAIVARYLRPGITVVEVGPGKGMVSPFRWDEWKRRMDIRLVGLDPDPSAAHNPFLDRFELLTDGRLWPIPDGCADLVVARYVLEHVADPDAFMANVVRVLRPGREFVFLTPNRASPVMWASRLLPHPVHVAILKATRGSEPSDVFSTYYRANSLRVLQRLARRHGLRVDHLAASEFVPFGYLDFFLPGFLAAVAYYHVVSRTRLHTYIGTSLTGVLTKMP